MIYIYTGDGKGKTTASVGLLTRAIGANKNCAIVFFDKNSDYCNELPALQKLGVECHIFGKNRVEKGSFRFDNNTDDLEEAKKAVQKANELIKKTDVLVLDEILNAIRLDQVKLQDTLNIIDKKPKNTYLILTGRGLPEEIKQKADLITEMKSIKHPFDKHKIIAQPGIDY